jgi:hypothetical protein
LAATAGFATALTREAAALVTGAFTGVLAAVLAAGATFAVGLGTEGAAFAALAGAGTLVDSRPESLTESGLATLWSGTGTAFAGTFALTTDAAFFVDSRVVLGAAGLADAFEAFAFNTTPFSAFAATTVLGTIDPSCRGEGDRR